MARVEFDEAPNRAYAELEKAAADELLDSIDAAIDVLEDDPAAAAARRSLFRRRPVGHPRP